MERSIVSGICESPKAQADSNGFVNRRSGFRLPPPAPGSEKAGNPDETAALGGEGGRKNRAGRYVAEPGALASSSGYEGSAEEWRPVVGFESAYEVSDRGRIRRVLAGMGCRAGRILTAGPHPKGYLTATFCVDGKPITRILHRVVIEAFHGPGGGREINHKDGDKKNNCAVNLEWCTRAENMDHAVRTGLFANAGKKTCRSCGGAGHNSRTCVAGRDPEARP